LFILLLGAIRLQKPQVSSGQKVENILVTRHIAKQFVHVAQLRYSQYVNE